jgi:hypothetical protein
MPAAARLVSSRSRSRHSRSRLRLPCSLRFSGPPNARLLDQAPEDDPAACPWVEDSVLPIVAAYFSFARQQDAINAELRLDGIYVIRTSLAAKVLDDTASVRAYKSLAHVERAIRSIKTVDLQVRPIFHWAAPRVRAHVCLCMLAYYVEWHMRQRLAPMLYDDADKEAAEALRTEALRTSIVAKAQRSPSAIGKQTYGTTPDGLPVHSFQSLLVDLATLAQNTVATALNPDHEFIVNTRPTTIQQKALHLLGVNPIHRTQ